MVRKNLKTKQPRRKPKKKVNKVRNNNNNKKSPKLKSSKANKLLRLIGGAIGGHVAGPLGSLVGSTAGDLFARISGMGEYHIHSNTLLNNQAPKFGKTTATRLRHSEFVMDVTTASTAGEFYNRQLQICPTNLTTFPWLQRIARNYEEYKFHGLVFYYKPTSGTAVGSTNTALGTVVMATQYDVTADPFVDKKAMEAYEYSSSCIPCDDMIHPVECDPRDNPLDVMYTRTGVLQNTSQDRRFHDLGNFNIATVGGQAADVTLGELWVSYDVELLKPRLPSASEGMWKSFVTMSTAGALSEPYVADNSDLNVTFDDASAPTEIVIEHPGYYLAISWLSSTTTPLSLQTGWALGDNTATISNSSYFNTNASNIFRIEDQSSPDRSSYARTFEVLPQGNGRLAIPTYTLGDICIQDMVVIRLASVDESYVPGPVESLTERKMPPSLEQNLRKLKRVQKEAKRQDSERPPTPRPTSLTETPQEQLARAKQYCQNRGFVYQDLGELYDATKGPGIPPVPSK
jgi:hypothetical protein